MAEKSYLWTTGGVGDGATTYTRSETSKFMKVVAACHAFEGVAPNFLNQFAGSVPGANSFRVASGGAMVDGKPYLNDANVDVTIPSAVGGGNTRIDRVVLRAVWSPQQVRISRIPGVDAASPTPPAIVQTSETTYDIMLYQVLVDTAGVVTIQLDERVFAKLADDSVVAAMIADGAIDAAAKLVDSVVTAAKIANRTRQFLVPPFRQEVPGASDFPYLVYGAWLANNVTRTVHGYFAVPNDFVSGMTVKAVVIPLGTGNIYAVHNAAYGAVGEVYNQHAVSGSTAAVAVTNNQRSAILSNALSSAAIGDLVAVEFGRMGGDALDTVNADAYLMGFLVEYTADS